MSLIAAMPPPELMPLIPATPSTRIAAQARLRLPLAAAVLSLSLMLAACGGGGASSDETGAAARVPVTSEAEAVRLLDQATFGATPIEVQRVRDLGASAWIDEQMAKPATSSRTHWEMLDRQNKAADPTAVSRTEVYHSFWHNAVSAPDQLRQRVAYALSQIMVVSMVDSGVNDQPRGVTSYYDMLGQHAFGNYRQLLQDVSLHPVMGIYLSHLRNQKEDLAKGRVPDENFAREVMQLFSIGLVELDLDGSASAGGPRETYGADDISGLAKVFTGWSWHCNGDTSDSCFHGWNESAKAYPDRSIASMRSYAKYHSASEKAFLGSTVAGGSDGDASLKVALDRLAAHPNVGPFIGRQLIQRLVTSHPSPAYVERVAKVFNNNGSGVRGDLKAVVKAVLLDTEARAPSAAQRDSFGKLREPVLRLSKVLRAFGATSTSSHWLIGNTDDPGTSLGQTPLRSPSVFNFYRPGYVPPNTLAAARSLTVPEMQITHETSVAGYANFMRSVVQNNGVGETPAGASTRDVQLDLSAARAAAHKPDELVALMNSRLFGGAMPAALADQIQAAVESITIPLLTSTNMVAWEAANSNRVRLALYLSVVSPEFIVQK
ncbi:Protein of unknown function DUF1800 [Leptothrix cholodnii SP-6]|uniref:DUF1800 domain-containing protein n=1 Tax=Leptothrix cholodnii (strain ATCC 51168 / LMG 8142 / SP-6) TaxID=395495 RepID=B1Y4U0_LEPCP|nr:DUF1800 domain-containing protein [Leptothrix cholodnii]ACB34653.1 Protein of unknown function DUF1800 [Leptothrix cholodnii SP-6]